MENIDEFHYHEVMDRTDMIRTMIEIFLCEHPAMKDEWVEWAQQADEFLGKIYNDCGMARRWK